MKNSYGLFDNAVRSALRLTVLAIVTFAVNHAAIAQFEYSANTLPPGTHSLVLSDGESDVILDGGTLIDDKSQSGIYLYTTDAPDNKGWELLNGSQWNMTLNSAGAQGVHLHSGSSDSTAVNQDLEITGWTMTLNADSQVGFWIHGVTNSINTIVAGGGTVPANESNFLFDTLTMSINGNNSTGISVQMVGSTLDIKNSTITVSGSNNFALIVPGVTGYDGTTNTVNIDSATTFNLGTGGNNTAIAIGANNTVLNIGATLTLQGIGDRGILIEGGNTTLDGVVINVGVAGNYYGGTLRMSNNSNAAIGILSDNSAAAARAAGTNHFSRLAITARGGAIGVKNESAAGGAGQYDEATGEIIPGGGSALEISASEFTVGAGSIGIWNNGLLLVDGTHITAAGNGIGIKNGYNDSFWIDPDAEDEDEGEAGEGEEGEGGGGEENEPPQYNYVYNNTAVLAVTDSTIQVVSGPAIDNYGVLTVKGTEIIGTGYNSVGIRDESVTGVSHLLDEDDEWYYGGYSYGGTTESSRPLTIEDSTIVVNGIGLSLEMNKFKYGSPDGAPLSVFYALFAPNYGTGESVGSAMVDYNNPDYINSLRQIEIIGTTIFAGYTAPDGTLNVDEYGDPNDPSYNILDHLLPVQPVNSTGTGISFQGNGNRFLIDSNSLIAASGYGIKDNPVAVLEGEDEDRYHAGNYSGVYNRIDLTGKVIAGRAGSQRVVANTDPETGKTLANLNDPLGDDFQKYVVVDPATGWQTPALDPVTNLPYIEPVTGLPYVKAEAINAEGYGLYLTGDSLGWGVEPDAWSTYFGPVVSKLTVLGDDALLTGGRAAIQIGDPLAYNYFYDEYDTDGIIYMSGSGYLYETTHVAQITTGRNSEVAVLTASIEDGKTDKRDLKKNYDYIATGLSQAERKTWLSYVDGSGIIGDIVSHYNGAVGVWEGNSESAEIFPRPYATATDFWSRTGADGAWIHYVEEVLGTTTISGSKSYLLGHRDILPVSDGDGVSPNWWTMATSSGAVEGRSVILDEILLEWGYASVTAPPAAGTEEPPAEETAEETAEAAPVMGADEVNLHFRDARDRMLAANNDAEVQALTGLTRAQILEGITRDGTLLQFQNDIFSGTIWGGGYGVTKPYTSGSSTFNYRQGNIDVVIGSSNNSQVQTTIFNGVTAYVRNFTVSSTGHLLMNDATVIADSFAGGDAGRLVIHDIYNEGKVSGNGSFELSKRSNGYAGYFVNSGVLAPGLGGYIGVGTDYNSATLVDGGQFGEIKFYGSPHFEASGTLEITVGNDTLGSLLAYYSQETPPADWRTTDFPDEETRQAAWDIVRQEQTATRAAWIDPAGWAALNRSPETLAALTELLSRYGISDVLDVHRLNATDPAVTRFGGTLQVDNIWENKYVSENDKKRSFIIAASDAYDGSGVFSGVVSETMDIVYSNVSILPTPLATGQKAAVLTVIDDANYYEHRVGNPYNAKQVASAFDEAMFSNPGLAQSMSFDLNSPEVFRDVFRQMAASTRANSVMMNLYSPTDTVFNQIGYGQGGLSTGNRGNVVFRDIRTNRQYQPYGQPAVPPPGYNYAAPNGGMIRGQAPIQRSGSAWGNYLHSSFAMGDDGNAFKYSFDRNGVIVGMEWNLTPSSAWGYTASAGYGTLRELSDKTRSSDYNMGLYYVAAPYEQFELKTFIGFGFQQYQNDRYLKNAEVHISHREGLFGLDDHYASETDGYSFNYALELARPFTVSPNFVVRPVWGFEIQAATQNGYSEDADKVSWNNSGNNISNGVLGAASGTYALDFRTMQFARSLTRLGFSTESYFSRGGWQSRAFLVSRFTGDDYPVSEQSFQSGSILFKARGSDLGKNYGQLGLGTHFWLNRERTATLYFDGDWGFSLGGDGGYSLLNFAMGLQQNF